MTITTEESTVHYIGNGVTTIFSFAFKTFQIEDIIAGIDGVASTNIDVILNPDQDISPGGTVEFLDGAPDPQTDVFIGRVVPKTQETDYQEYDPFPAASHERALDKLTMLVQQQVNVFENSLRVPLSDPPNINKELPGPAARALQFPFFDEFGNLVLSFGTDIEEVVKGITIEDDSLTMLIADNVTDTEFPRIGVNNINGEAGLMRLTAQGDYPQFPGLPGGGLPIEVLSQTPFLLFAVLIDDGTLAPGTDSGEMLTTFRQSNPADPFGFVDVLGVNTPNQPLHLVQTDEFGQIPPELLQFVGLRNRGIFRGDDLCDKPGDGVGDCTAPDTRNPSQRFPGLDYPPGTDPGTQPGQSWRAGDFFAVTMAAGETEGEMLLFTELGQAAPALVTVEANDGIIFIPQIIDPDPPNDVLVQHGWYHQPERFSLTTANLVSLNTAGYGFIGPLPTDDVQQAFNFLDNALALFRADQSSFDTSGGTIIIQPSSEDVQAALEDLDQGVVSLATAQDIAGLKTFLVNVLMTAAQSVSGTSLTRRDFVEAADAAVLVVANQGITDAATAQAAAVAAQSTADTAQSAAVAANANANTRKLETDFIRSGDRLDINNVRTS